MSQTSSVDNCLKVQQQIVSSSSTLHRITELKTADKKINKSIVKQRCATHLLFKDHAWPLDKPLSISMQDNQLRLSNSIDNKAAFVAVIEDRQLRIMHQSTSIDMQVPSQCEPGQLLIIAGHRLTLIEVSNA